jgi:endogenous inhibitor of DNA gyrase (YacG/DUF329 family)
MKSRSITCRSCGGPIPQRTPRDATRVYCSAECHRPLNWRVPISCATCGVEILNAHGRRKFCSERCRKHQYDRVCIDCGGPCDGASGLKKIATRCLPCARQHSHDSAHWTRERVIEALQEWATMTGWLPSASEWNPASVQNDARREALLRFRATGHWPYTNTVLSVFGSWNAAMEAAGFEPRPMHAGRPSNARMAEWIARYDELAAA